MKKHFVIMLPVFAAFVLVSAICAPAQFTIKIPKIKKEKPPVEQPRTESIPSSDSGSPASGESSGSRYSAAVGKSQYDFIRPTADPQLVTDSIYIQAETRDEYWKMPRQKYSSWLPKVRFGLFYDWKLTLPHLVEYFNSDGSLWFSETIEGEMPGDNRVVPFKTGRGYVDKMWESKSTAATGIYGIKITNTKSGKMIFQGKFKVGKFPREYKGKNEVEFYVDHDWILPIGTVSFHHSNFSGQDIGFNFPVEVSMWFKKNPGSDHQLEARLFYKGQQIAVTKRLEGYEDRASEVGNLSADLHHWKRLQFQWSSENVNVDNGGSYHKDNMPKSFFVDRNPGEYTVKVYDKAVQVREAKFTVGTDGRIVDGGYQKPGYLAYYKVIIPVTVIGTSEKWNAAAWKTEAFYGNPMAGFTVQ
ncbi:MAG: hypothetical protein H7070_01035 [Saprospiraceae bacterium]|nr:hypothetical protein [Pyrinomonadaceae bacterium]